MASIPITSITSLDDSRLDAYARLTERQLRSVVEPSLGLFIAESAKVIERAVQAGLEPVSFLLSERWIDQLTPLLKDVCSAHPEVVVFCAPGEVLHQLTGFEVTRGALAAFRRPTLPDPSTLLAEICERKSGHPVRVCVLEGIVDHTNVGAIFRSAAALNIDAILVSPTCCDPLYRRAVRVSMGTVFQVPWCRIGSTASNWPRDGLALLHEAGFVNAALALCDDSLALDDPKLAQTQRLALFMGTEGSGLAARTVLESDVRVRIPMAHGVDSLNVAAASAVTFWELCERASNGYTYQPSMFQH